MRLLFTAGLPPGVGLLQYTVLTGHRVVFRGKHAMAHKKGQGSVRNGRDSQPQRRGIKLYGGQAATVGSIIVTQCGTRFSPGRYVRRAKNDTLFAMADGKVYFDQGGKRVNILPADPAATTV
jgi:large subunit ribosomal protein L27